MTINDYWTGSAAGTLMRLAQYIPVYKNFANWADFLMRYLYGSREIRDDLSSGGIEMCIQAYMNAHEYEYQTLYNTTNLDYNPIENYNMTEQGDDSTTRADSVETGAHTTTVSVAPFDSETFQAAQQSSTPKITSDNSGTSSTHYEHSRTGNIGTLTTQQMIEQERRVSNLALAEKLAKEVANLISIGIYE